MVYTYCENALELQAFGETVCRQERMYRKIEQNFSKRMALEVFELHSHPKATRAYAWTPAGKTLSEWIQSKLNAVIAS